ncbi:hypothetical protein b3_0318 [Synechococcus phage B3]|jgi:hypothetical protein|nr:hypothetical protein b3_0318 [Synechococcus phage B3]QGT54924.1 hypothetical protein b23_0311 [Synechococcus phage B23]
MFFDELSEENFLLFAIKNYNNPQGLTEEDFYKDLNHFKYIKRHLKKYKVSGELKIHLLLKHFIILYNIFGDATTPMLFFKVPNNLWSSMKTFIVFLNRLPEYPKCYIHEIEFDSFCMEKLQEIVNGKD